MKIFCAVITMIVCSFQFCWPQSDSVRDEHMQWWREARFGMFIHWGLYAVPAGTYHGQKINHVGEWIMNDAKIPVTEYRAFAKQFNPGHYDADAWVRMAKDAGMKYIVITAKHHDGFAMFGSKASTWNIVDASPYGKDVLKPLVEACKKYGMKLGFYYSQAQDWNNPGGAVTRNLANRYCRNSDSAAIDAYTEKHSGHWDSLQTTKTMVQYIDDVAVPQVKELLTNYGDVAVLWWDTPTNMTDDAAEKLQALLKLQPYIITNDRLKRPNFPGDYKTPENRIPKLGDLDGKDWETCMTMNETWGYKNYDQHWKTPGMLVRNLIDIASKGGNYLLNVGPTVEGEFPEQSVQALKAIGAWMKINGEAIYATKASPLQPFLWGRCTMKEHRDGTTLYLSVFDWPADGRLVVPVLKNEIRSSTLLVNSEPLNTTLSGEGVIITLPQAAPDSIASVIKIEVKGNVASGAIPSPLKAK